MSLLFVGASGAITPCGLGVDMNYAALRAGISAYQSSEFFGRDQQAVKLACVPRDALPCLTESTEGLGGREVRMLQLATTALKQCFSQLHLPSAPALLLAAPELYPGMARNFPASFLAHLAKESKIALNLGQSRVFALGRTGGHHALDYAFKFMETTAAPYVLIGGVDTYRDPHLLALMERDGRLLTERNSDGFVPGEGASFILLMQEAFVLDYKIPVLGSVLEPGLGNEPGHIYSSAPLLGAGMTAAVRDAVEKMDGHLLDKLYSSMNGERLFAKELGVALMRTRPLKEGFKHNHPAEATGDLGAATLPFLIAMAMHKSNEASLIACASDGAYRGAVCVKGKKPITVEA